MKKVVCMRNHRMVEVIPGFALCECSTYGRLSYLKGIEEEARRLVEKCGGIERIRDKIEKTEAERKAKRGAAQAKRA